MVVYLIGYIFLEKALDRIFKKCCEMKWMENIFGLKFVKKDFLKILIIEKIIPLAFEKNIKRY